MLLPGTAGAGGAIAVVAPGTGLGEAFLVHDGTRLRAYPSEGGHCDFGPVDAEQVDLLQWCERAASTTSATNASARASACRTSTRSSARPVGRRPSPRVAAALAAARDPTPIICEQALLPEPDPACAATVALFVRILAQESGNLALRVLGTGGLFLAGGLARRLRKLLDPAVFSDAFRRKGRLGEMLVDVPVSLVTADRVALLGAAARGLEDF